MKPKTVLVAGCLHIPYIDYYYEEWLLQQVRDTQPDVLVLNGDVIDGESLSRFPKTHRYAALEEEYEGMEAFLSRLLKVTDPNTECVYLKGNHEHRLRTPSFSHLSGLLDIEKHVPSLDRFKTKEYINHISYAYRYGLLTVRHSFETSDVGIKREVLDCCRPNGLLVTSHTHRGHNPRQLEWLQRPLPFTVVNTGCGLARSDTAYYSGWNTNGWNRGCAVVGVNDRWFNAEFRKHSDFWGN